MVKIYTHTEEIEHCEECACIFQHISEDKTVWRCGKASGRPRIIENNIWGKIPKWCPLPDGISDADIIAARDYLDSAAVPTENRRLA